MVATRTKACPTCGKRFSYEVGKGKDRKLCGGALCSASRRRLQRQERLKQYGPCANPDCNRPASRVSHGLCDTCYCRVRRNGHYEPSEPPKYRYRTGAGYYKVLIPEHPLADARGCVFEHRKVAYEKYGAGQRRCFWCGKVLEWANVVVDHLNEVKSDNRPENLVISCNDCNRARGAMLPFIDRLRPEALKQLIQCIGQRHSADTEIESR